MRIFAVLGSDHHIFQWIGTKFPAELKLSNADFVLSGKWDRKYKTDFRDVQIPVSVLISVLWNDYARKLVVDFHQTVHAIRTWSARRVLSLWETRTGFPILEVCRFIF